MAKKKAYCYNCAYYLKTDGGIPRLEQYNKCGNPTKGFGSKKVKATAINPAHTTPITIPPGVINKRNDCTGWMFLVFGYTRESLRGK